MSAKTIWLTEREWNRLPARVRQQVREAVEVSLPEYVSNIEAALRDRGEHEAAEALLEAVGLYIVRGEETPSRAPEVTWEHLGSWDVDQYRAWLAEDPSNTPEVLVEELISTGTIAEEDRESTLRFLRNENPTAYVRDARELLARGIPWDAIAVLMDDDIREEIHYRLAPCSDLLFLAAYMERHYEHVGEPFIVN